MDDEDLAQAQARLLSQAIDQAALKLNDVWLYYFSIGGSVGELEMEAYLHHAMPLPPLERDLLAHAVNEMIDHRPVLYAPYSTDLPESEGSRGERTSGEDHDADADDRPDGP